MKQPSFLSPPSSLFSAYDKPFDVNHLALHLNSPPTLLYPTLPCLTLLFDLFNSSLLHLPRLLVTIMMTLCHTGSATKSPATSITLTIVSTYHLLPVIAMDG